MTRDLRRRALESTKTVSRKAQSKMSSIPSSAGNSRTASTSGSKHGSQHGSRHGSDDEDASLSDSTAWSVNSIDEMITVEPEDDSVEWKQELADRIEEIIDRKRSSVLGRETALKTYMEYLMRRYCRDQIEPKMGELIPALLKSVKSEDSEKETTSALKAIALTLITAPSENAYENLYAALKRCYTSSESFEVKAAAIHTLSAAAIYAGASDSATEELLEELLMIIESDGASIEAADSAEVVTAALEEWGFLATYVDDLEDQTELAMEAFVEQLESTETSVQVSAGENIALLYAKSRSEGDEDDGNHEASSPTQRYEVYRNETQLKHTLSTLAGASAKSISKKDRKILHSNFSDILQTVEHPNLGPRYSNAYDQETGKPYGYRLEVRIHRTGRIGINAWWKLLRLQMLRRVLGAGFVVHYEHNDVVFATLPVVMTEAK